MYSSTEKKQVVLHLEKDIDSLDDIDLSRIDDELKELEKVCEGKIVVSSDKKSGYKKIIFTCETKPVMKDDNNEG